MFGIFFFCERYIHIYVYVGSFFVSKDGIMKGVLESGDESGMTCCNVTVVTGIKLAGTAIVAHIKRTHSLSLSTSENS